MENESEQMLDSHKTLNVVLTTTAASLSLMGTLLIFLTFFLWPELRTNGRRIITFIAIADFVLALTNIVGLWRGEPNGTSRIQVCELQGTIGMAAVMSSFFWTFYLSLYFYLTICKKIARGSEKLVISFFHLTAWGVPIVTAVSAIIMDQIGSDKDFVTAGWCWVGINHDWQSTLLWMVIGGKGWEILAYFTITQFFFLVKLQIRRELNSGFHEGSRFLTQRSIEVAKKVHHKLLFIPLVFVVLRIWGTVRFIRFVCCLPNCFKTGPSQTGWLIVLHGIGDNSQGFANFILFCVLTEKIRRRYRMCLGKFLSCCKPQETVALCNNESTNLIRGNHGVDYHCTQTEAHLT